MKKDKQFSIRIAAQDLETIRQKAAQAHMSQSDYVTACCLGKRIVILDGLKEVLRQQKAIGNNLNQLAVLANMGKVQFANLDTAAQEFAKINVTLRERAFHAPLPCSSVPNKTRFAGLLFGRGKRKIRRKICEKINNSAFGSQNRIWKQYAEKRCKRT